MDICSKEIHLKNRSKHPTPRYPKQEGVEKVVRNKEIRNYIAQGYTLADVAEIFYISKPRVREILLVYFADFYEEFRDTRHRGKGKIREHQKRDRKIFILNETGFGCAKLANMFGLCQGRIHQIIKREIADN